MVGYCNVKHLKKIITSEELTKQINPKNTKLVNRFLQNFKTKRSGRSAKSYLSNYNIFFTWNLLNNDNKFFIDIKKMEMMDFFDYGVNELHWSPNRYAQVWSSLSSLSNFIENMLDEEYPLFRNVVKRIEKLPKEPVRKKSVFTKQDLDKLMEWLDSENLIQEKCLLATIMASGARISELLRFTTDIIDLDNTIFDGLFIETTEEMKVKGRGTTGKHMKRVLITDFFKPYFLEWMPIREKIMKENNQNHNVLFIKADGTPAKVSTLRSWMTKWDEHLPSHWYPHAGRHFWTSYLLGIGLEPQLVQELQQWSSDQMLKIYNDNGIAERKWKGLDKLKNQLEKEKAIVSDKSENS